MSFVEEAVLNIKGNNQLSPVLDQVRQQFNAVTSNMKSQIQSLQQSLTTFNQPVQTNTRTIQAFNAQGLQLTTTLKGIDTQFKAGLTSVNAHGNALMNNTKQLQANIQQGTQYGKTITSTVSGMSTLAIGIGSTAQGLETFRRSWRDLEDTQIAVDRTTKKLSVAQEAQTKAQEKVNEFMKKGISSGKDYQQAVLDLDQANQQLSISTDLQAEALEAQGDTYSNFYMSILPTAITATGTLGQAFKTLNLDSDKLGKGVGKLGDFFHGTAGKITILGAGIAAASLVIASYQRHLADIGSAHSVLEQHVRDWTAVRETFEQIQFNIETDPIRLAVATISGSLDTLKKEIAAMKNIEGLGSVVDDILFGPHVQALPASAEKMVKSRLEFIKRTLSNPNNFVDEHYTETTLKLIAAALADVDGIINKSLPTWAKNKDAIDLTANSIERATTLLQDFSRTPQGDVAFSNAIAKGKSFSSTIVDINAQLVQHAQELNVDSELVNKYSYATGQSTDRVIANNLELKKLIHSHKGELVPALDDTTESTAKLGEGMHQATDAFTGFFKEAEKADQIKEKWKSFADEFNKATNLKSALEISFDKADITKDLLKSLPNKLEKDIKLDLKAEEKATIGGQAVQDYLQGLLEAKPSGGFRWDPDLKIDDKDAQDIANNLIDDIDNNLDPEGQNASLQNLKATLQKAIDDGASESDIMAILASHVEGAPELPVKATIADESLNKLAETIKNAIGTIFVPIEPEYNFKNDTLNPHAGMRWDGKKWVKDKGKGGFQNTAFGGGPQFTDPNENNLGNKITGGGGGANVFGGGAYQMLRIGGDGRRPQGGGGQGGVAEWNIMARQLDQVTKNLNMLARALVQTIKDLNLIARVLNQVTTNLNVHARAINQVMINYNLFARVIVQLTKNNNTYAQTVVQVTKDHDILARTIDQLTKNNNLYARTIAQITTNLEDETAATLDLIKANNVAAKTIVQMGKNLKTFANDVANATDEVQGLKSAINSLKSKTVTVTVKTKNAGGQEGYFNIVSSEQTVTFGEHNFPEAVRVRPLRGHSLKEDFGGDVDPDGAKGLRNKIVDKVKSGIRNAGAGVGGGCVVIKLVTPDGRVITEMTYPHLLRHLGAMH